MYIDIGFGHTIHVIMNVKGQKVTAQAGRFCGPQAQHRGKDNSTPTKVTGSTNSSPEHGGGVHTPWHDLDKKWMGWS